jgi:hypothetical protein
MFAGTALSVPVRLSPSRAQPSLRGAATSEAREMSGYKTGFDDRKTASAEAKKQQLERLRAKLNQVDPEKVAARKAVEAAREEREAKKRAEREAQLAAERAAQAAKEAEEAAKREAELLAQEAEKASLEAEDRARAEAAEALRAEQKAARDARYAARKNRKRRG